MVDTFLDMAADFPVPVLSGTHSKVRVKMHIGKNKQTHKQTKNEGRNIHLSMIPAYLNRL